MKPFGVGFLLLLGYSNCQAIETPEDFDISALDFQKGVVTHVLFHEFAHAFIHEFQVLVLSNEEAMADAFATYYITRHLRDEAVDIITSRALSWMIEDSEVLPEDYDMKGEHDLDLRRAYQALCQIYGADPAEWRSYFEWVGFSQNDLSGCSETSPAIESGWNQVVGAHRNPGSNAGKVSVIYGEGELKEWVRAYGVLEQVQREMEQFAWPRPIIIHFDHCPDGAYWSRSERKIMLCDAYVQRFIDQSRQLNLE